MEEGMHALILPLPSKLNLPPQAINCLVLASEWRVIRSHTWQGQGGEIRTLLGLNNWPSCFFVCFVLFCNIDWSHCCGIGGKSTVCTPSGLVQHGHCDHLESKLSGWDIPVSPLSFHLPHRHIFNILKKDLFYVYLLSSVSFLKWPWWPRLVHAEANRTFIWVS